MRTLKTAGCIFAFAAALFQGSVFASGLSLSDLNKKEPVRVSGELAKVSEKISFGEKRAKLLKHALDSAAAKYKGAKLSYVLVQGEKTLLIRDDFEGEYLPIGKSSRAVLSLAIGAMESRGILDSSRPAKLGSDFFRIPNKTLENKVSLKDLYSMRAGVASKHDELFDARHSPEEFFQAFYLSDPAAYGYYQESALSVSAAAYIAALRFDPEEKNLDASYFKLLKEFVFIPLNMKGGLLGRLKFPPDNGVALNIEGIARWLSCETSFGRGAAGVQVANPDILDFRYEMFEGEKRTASFVKITVEGMDFYASGDEFEGLSHIIIINRGMRTAFAVFAAKAPKDLCMDLAREYARLLSDIGKTP